MELVEGQTLAGLMPSQGLPLDRLLKFAIPLASAVSAAHERGIIHRDLKPANVMVGRDDRVKVLDFGLAKLLEATPLDPEMATAHASGRLTAEGRIVGSVPYMSPEQAEGRPIDQRSDIFSLGIILYEMATGRRPFTGDSSLSILSSIIRDTPPPVTDINHALPRDLGRIVRRCLQRATNRFLWDLDRQSGREQAARAAPPNGRSESLSSPVVTGRVADDGERRLTPTRASRATGSICRR